MEQKKIVVNPSDKEYFDSCFKISLYNYDNTFYFVFQDNAQEALDTLVDWLEEKGYTGYFLTEEEVRENINAIVAGNHCRYLDGDHLCIIQDNL